MPITLHDFTKKNVVVSSAMPVFGTICSAVGCDTSCQNTPRNFSGIKVLKDKN